MNCKFCNAELEEGMTLCRACGKENLEKTMEVETLVEETEMITEETAEIPAEETAMEMTEETAEIPVEATTMEMAEETAEIPVEATTEEMAEETVEKAAEAAPRKKPGLWVTILAILGGLVLAAVLVGAVLYGTGVIGGAKMATYTVSDEQAVKARDTVVATVGDVELTNSELQIYYRQTINEFYNYYGYYMDLSTLGLDINQPLDTQYYEDGVTWQQYFLESALSAWSRYAALHQHGKEAGFALDAEAQSYVDSIGQQLETMAVTYGYETAQEMLEADMSTGCDVEGYLKFVDLNFYAGQYMNSLYTALEPTLEEIQAYYAQNTDALNAQGITADGSKVVDVRHILLCPVSSAEDGSFTDADWEACRVQAQQLLDQWLNEDGTEEGFAALAMEKTEDPGSQSAGGLYTDVYQGQMVEPFENWCFDESRSYGDSGLVQTTYGYHIMFFVGSEENWISEVRSSMINERSLALVEEAVAKWPMEVNYKKIALGEPSAK